MSPTFKRVKEKINQLSEKEKNNDSVIIQNGDNFYVYGLYVIEKNNNCFDLYYADGNEYIVTMFTSVSAISWCNAMKAMDVQLASKIADADRKLEYLSNDIVLTKARLRKKDLDVFTTNVLVSRLQEYVIEQYQLKLNLHKYIQLSKEIKNKGFSNEFTTSTDTKNLTRVR